jgi:hypothetical protein
MGKPLYDGWLKHICAELYVIFSRTKTGVQKAFLLAYYYWSYHARGRWQIATLRFAFIFFHHLWITRLSEETISILYVIYRKLFYGKPSHSLLHLHNETFISPHNADSILISPCHWTGS